MEKHHGEQLVVLINFVARLQEVQLGFTNRAKGAM